MTSTLQRTAVLTDGSEYHGSVVKGKRDLRTVFPSPRPACVRGCVCASARPLTYMLAGQKRVNPRPRMLIFRADRRPEAEPYFAGQSVRPLASASLRGGPRRGRPAEAPAGPFLILGPFTRCMMFGSDSENYVRKSQRLYTRAYLSYSLSHAITVRRCLNTYLLFFFFSSYFRRSPDFSHAQKPQHDVKCC